MFALAAILFRAVIPMGFMPVANADTGAIEIAVCSSHLDAEPFRLPGPDKGLSGKLSGKSAPKGAETAACPFAMPAPPVLPDVAAQASAPAIYAFEFARAERQRPASHLAWEPHAPPTGPPVLI